MTLNNASLSDTTATSLLPNLPDPAQGAHSPAAIGAEKIFGIIIGSLTGVFQFFVIFFAILYRWLRDNANGKYPKLQRFSKVGFTICESVLRGLKAVNCCSRRSSGPSEIDYEMGNERHELISGYQTTKCD